MLCWWLSTVISRHISRLYTMTDLLRWNENTFARLKYVFWKPGRIGACIIKMKHICAEKSNMMQEDITSHRHKVRVSSQDPGVIVDEDRSWNIHRPGIRRCYGGYVLIWYQVFMHDLWKIIIDYVPLGKKIIDICAIGEDNYWYTHVLIMCHDNHWSVNDVLLGKIIIDPWMMCYWGR